MELVLSPKYQVLPPPPGIEVLVKEMLLPVQEEVALFVKPAVRLPMLTAPGMTIVSLQPAALVAMSVTLKVPEVVYVWEGDAAVEVFPLPKFHKYETAPEEVFVKLTVSGEVQLLLLLKVKFASGNGATVM